MQISRKSDYAIRAITVLATVGTDRSMQAQEIAKTAKIPFKFLEQILLVLKRAGLLQSKRGVGGGYRLNRESHQICIADVIEAVEGQLIRLSDSTGIPPFDGSAGIVYYLGIAEDAVNSQLRSTSIEDLVRHDEGDRMAGYGI
jgi:Rrf2 family protein